MANTVGVNKLSVITKDSNGITTAFPDVCKTPSPGDEAGKNTPPFPVVQPPVIAMGGSAEKPKCRCCGEPRK